MRLLKMGLLSMVWGCFVGHGQIFWPATGPDRVLDLGQASALVAALTPSWEGIKERQIYVDYHVSDPECRKYARELADVFRRSGFIVIFRGRTDPFVGLDEHPGGLYLIERDYRFTATFEQVSRAFSDNGIRVLGRRMCWMRRDDSLFLEVWERPVEW